MRIILLSLVLGILFSACTHEPSDPSLGLQLQNRLAQLSPGNNLDYFILPAGDDLANIPQGVANPLTPEKVALGKMLFFETGLAQDSKYADGFGTYSCGTCHVPSAGFMPGRKQGIADGGAGFGFNGESRGQMPSYDEYELDVQGARPLSMLNVAFVTNSTWSGKFGANHANADTEHLWGVNDASTEGNHLGMDGLETQNIEGLKIHRMRITEGCLDSLGYLPMYDAAFPDIAKEERYTHLTTSFALSAYIRTLMADQAPFQMWLKGDENAMAEDEIRGALLFFDKAGCYRCHQGAALNAVEFHALGVKDLYEAGGLATGPNDLRNLGRGGFTEREEDMYKFKVPQLYNLKDSPFYFHGSSKYSLWSVVEYFNAGIPENPNVPESQISPYFQPLGLTEEEKRELTLFLSRSLHDPNLQRYVPESILSGNCFPNNDPASREELGCQ